MTMTDFPDGRILTSACRFSSLVTRDPQALAQYLAREGFLDGQRTIGEVAHRYHPQRAVRLLIFRSGVVLSFSHSWDELRSVIAALIHLGLATRAGDPCLHGAGVSTPPALLKHRADAA
jgi:hypothetical protein